MTPEIAVHLGQQHLLGAASIEPTSIEATWCLTSDPHTRSLEPFVFLHIPKTAGSSIRPIFRSLFDEDRIYPGVNFPDYAVETIDESSAFSASSVFIGHMTWDAIQEIERRAGSRINVVTLFREPSSHLNSQSAFHDRLLESGIDPGVRSGSIAIGLQIALLLGVDHHKRLVDAFAERNASSTNRQIFADALRSTHLILLKRLERDLKFGIFENLRGSVDLICHHLKLPYVEISEERINASGARADAPPTLEDKNYADQWNGIFSDFYTETKRRFDAEYASAFDGVADIPVFLNERYKAQLRQTMQRCWCASFPASNAWPGFGWEPRQGMYDGQDGRIRRAIGESGRSTLFARLRNELAYTVRVSISYAASERVAQGLRVYANGDLLTSKVRWFEPGYIFLQWPIPRASLAATDGWLELAFEIPRCLRFDVLFDRISVVPTTARYRRKVLLRSARQAVARLALRVIDGPLEGLIGRCVRS